MDYSKLSDEEINKRVATGIGVNPYIADGGLSEIYRDYCNNPTDAWPILLKNRISIEFDSSYDGDEPAEWVKASANAGEHFSHNICNKALRAAMIVFIIMKDAQK